MKWKAKPDRKLGDRKVCRRFAFVPKKIDEWWYWLEPYSVVKEWTTISYTNPESKQKFVWNDWKIVDTYR